MLVCLSGLAVLLAVLVQYLLLKHPAQTR